MEILAVVNGVTLYDDFAHHPTAISATLKGLKYHVKDQRIFAIVEPRSNTMRSGIHADALPRSMRDADLAIIYQPEGINLNITEFGVQENNLCILQSLDQVVDLLIERSSPGDHLVFMSNGSFGGVQARVKQALIEKFST